MSEGKLISEIPANLQLALHQFELHFSFCMDFLVPDTCTLHAVFPNEAKHQLLPDILFCYRQQHSPSQQISELTLTLASSSPSPMCKNLAGHIFSTSFSIILNSLSSFFFLILRILIQPFSNFRFSYFLVSVEITDKMPSG